jgi:glutathione S-transferase
MSTVNLFGLERSVYTRIVRLALEEKSIEYALNEVEIFGAGGVPPEHLARQPFGRIPAFEHNGFRLYETSAITRYVDEAFPGVQLQPQEPQARARMHQVIGLLDAYAYKPLIWGAFVERIAVPRAGGTPNEANIAEAMRTARVCLDALDEIVAYNPFLLGANITLADLHAFPILKYFSLAQEGRDLISTHTALDNWLRMMELRPAVQRTRTSFETQ